MGRDYGEFCPISLGAEVFAERWTPIILRNLALGAYRFTDILAGVPGVPRSVLVSRLRGLEVDGVVTRESSGLATEYRLTVAGRELAQVAVALGKWGARWRHRRPHAVNPFMALWVLAHLIPTEELPRPQVVVQFDVRGLAEPDRLWLVAAVDGCELFVEHPNLVVDGTVRCDAESLLDWHLGVLPLTTGMRTGAIEVDSGRWLVRLLTSWGRLSPFAGVRPAVESRALAGAG